MQAQYKLYRHVYKKLHVASASKFKQRNGFKKKNKYLQEFDSKIPNLIAKRSLKKVNLY